MYTGSLFITVEFFGTLSVAATPWGLIASPAPTKLRSITLAEAAKSLRLYTKNTFAAEDTASYRAEYIAAHRGENPKTFTPGNRQYWRDWPNGCPLL